MNDTEVRRSKNQLAQWSCTVSRVVSIGSRRQKRFDTTLYAVLILGMLAASVPTVSAVRHQPNVTIVQLMQRSTGTKARYGLAVINGFVTTMSLAASKHSIANDLEQVATLLYIQANSASYPLRDDK